MTEIFQSTLAVGTILDSKWIILEFIGKGGMGEVYRAYQLNLKRDVAIKIVSQEYLRSFDCDIEEMENSLERFHREVQVMAQVHHPNIIQIFDHGVVTVHKGEQQAGFEYVAIEYVPGSTLRTTMSEEGFAPDEERMEQWLSTYFLPLLDGVEAMHEHGVIHRDLKPENILLAGKVPKIADFGLARSCSVKPITQSAHMMGTPQYMAPEQFMDMRRTDEKADIYSLAKMLYEAASGKIGPNHIPFRQASLKDPEGAFYKELDQIIRRGTAENRSGRFASTGELRRAVATLLKGLRGEPLVPPAAPAEEVSTPAAPQGRSWAPKVILTLAFGVIVAIVTVALFGGPELSQHGSRDSLTDSGDRLDAGDTARPPAGSSSTSTVEPPPAKRITSRDGALLHLAPGGVVSLPLKLSTEGRRQVQVNAFYMDETPVTNHQYVEFLNKVMPKLSVSNGVVRGEGEMWLFLGEVTLGYEPIVFRDGRFHVSMAHHAACPVLRVTGYGAAAFARFYEKRLPTVAEWFLATTEGSFQEKGQTPGFPDKHLPIPSPVMEYRPNALKIRGLNANVGEWGVWGRGVQSEAADASLEYVVLGGMPAEVAERTGIALPVRRQPWEAFAKVGFRTVRDLVQETE